MWGKLFKGLIFSLLCSCSGMVVFAFSHVTWTEDMYSFVREQYGYMTEQRFRLWHDLIDRQGHETWKDDIESVNDFFNEVAWTSDTLHWGKKEYWQTPLETLVDFEGDCEDIALAKFTTLRIMGYSEDQLNLVYAQTRGTAHMVLVFYHESSETPYVLDSLNKRLLTIDNRPDLKTVYEFNNDSIWLMDKHFHKLTQAYPEHIALLNELKGRLERNRHLLMAHNDGVPVVPFDVNML